MLSVYTYADTQSFNPLFIEILNPAASAIIIAGISKMPCGRVKSKISLLVIQTVADLIILPIRKPFSMRFVVVKIPNPKIKSIIKLKLFLN